jgi:hypothetical protein
MEPIAHRIDRAMKHALVPDLRRSGFKGSGRTFHRRLDYAVQVVNVQASMSNFADTGRFTINLGVFFPEVAAFIDPGRVPERPKEYQCTIRARIGKPMDAATDYWWSVGPNTIDSQLGDEVAKTFFTYGLPWLERYSSLPAVPEALGRDVLVRAACLAVLGRRHDAQALVRASIAEDPERTAYLADWSRRRGLLPSSNDAV